MFLREQEHACICCGLWASDDLPVHLWPSEATCHVHSRANTSTSYFNIPNLGGLFRVEIRLFLDWSVWTDSPQPCRIWEKEIKLSLQILRQRASGALKEASFTYHSCKASPQGSQVPQLYPIANGCGGKKVINLILLGREWWTLWL